MMKRKFSKSANKNKAVPLGLALQGGGAYGAYTKGTLKALLESDIITTNKAEIIAVTGSSAGAVNGALLVHGLNSSGADQAIKNLDALWNDVGQQGKAAMGLNPIFNMMAQGSWPNLPKRMLAIGRMMVPRNYIIEQLKNTVERHIQDWKPIQNGPVKLFVNATKEDAKTKERSHHVFKGNAISSDSITASGALQEFGAHKINNENYYDGAYWRNPCFTDIQKENISDLLVVTIQEHPKEPITAEHQDKLREKFKKPGHEPITSEIHHHLAHLHEKNKKINLHVISMIVDDKWNETSRLNTDPRWLAQLEKQGYQDGQKWIQDHGSKLGKQSSYETPCYKKPQKGCDCPSP